ncbi:molybdopterin-dependent oxidoreductase [Cellulomonas humilata]|uniref:DMSO/TMAO reductase YedYZ molybdopterin-dependent catalytic subunit n=1 Tax=Cellulomonas humilata TaxID=144055 RepID=A0ABU0ED39_9CELL|nr:molybdopterin-dependent oxidoreductase [Cellulomonas humilata]MDQ0373181.1 DMSO/TMAO reductase YedYZ molybdopterin-dependent catalytic subunit [Cellulomonas humilata]
MATRRDTGLAALAGLAAGVVTLGVGSLVALITGPSTDPLVAVGSAFVDATPAWLKDFAASTFGTADKVVLGIGEVLVILALAALAGVLAARRWAWGATLVVVLGAVAALAAMGRPDAGTLAGAPAVVGAIAGLLTLRELVRRLPGAPGRPRPEGVQRRAFLQATAAAGALGVVGVVLGRAIGAGARGAQSARAAVRIPSPTTTAAPVPAGVDVGVDGVGPWQTPPDEFYRIDTALVVPQVDPSTWSLRVHGMVEEEVTLTWDELLEGDLVEAWVTLACVSNPVGGDLIGNQKWLGMPIADLLARARPTGDADMVLSRSVDGFTASTPLAALTDGRDALLAIAMDGEPLPVEHGFPVRMVVPGLYGYVSATKWVTELRVTRFADDTAYWTERGWSAEGPIKTQSRIEVPRPGTSVPAGSVVVAGTAWAQHRGITGVQVRVDQGSWNDATLADDGSIDSWRQWSWTWDAEPGEYQLFVRASDPQGPQTGAVAGVIPDGATGYDTVRVTVT